MNYILAFRFSAMGDVALTVPVVRSVLEHYADLHITLVTRKAFAPMFSGINRLEIVPADFSGTHKGLNGLFRLFREIRRKREFIAVADLHDVLRTKLLCLLFRVKGIKVYRIDKGRREKRNLIHTKNIVPLKNTVDRYLSVFGNAGFVTQLVAGPYFPVQERNNIMEEKGKQIIRIGIAPCARHILKEWPVERMVALMQLIREKHHARFYLFGGKDEESRLAIIADQVPETSMEAVSIPLREQMALMAGIHLMITMDSANMHLAALTGIPLVVIWGATHPFAGFTPAGDHEKGFVQISKYELSCRPCTVYGKGTCRRGDHACMKRITPKMVYQKILALGIPEFSV